MAPFLCINICSMNPFLSNCRFYFIFLDHLIMHFWNYDGKQTFLKFSPFGVWFLNWSYHAAGPVYWPNVWPPGDEEEHFPECNSPQKCSAEREAGPGWSNDRIGYSGWDFDVWTIILHSNKLYFNFCFPIWVYHQLFLKCKLKLCYSKRISTHLWRFWRPSGNRWRWRVSTCCQKLATRSTKLSRKVQGSQS